MFQRGTQRKDQCGTGGGTDVRSSNPRKRRESTRRVSTSAMNTYTLSNQTSTNCGLKRCQTNTLEPTVKSTKSSVAVLTLSSLNERKRTFETINRPKAIVTQNKSSV